VASQNGAAAAKVQELKDNEYEFTARVLGWSAFANLNTGYA
jgi:hypothetical protein